MAARETNRQLLCSTYIKDCRWRNRNANARRRCHLFSLVDRCLSDLSVAVGPSTIANWTLHSSRHVRFVFSSSTLPINYFITSDRTVNAVKVSWDLRGFLMLKGWFGVHWWFPEMSSNASLSFFFFFQSLFWILRFFSLFLLIDFWVKYNEEDISVGLFIF